MKGFGETNFCPECGLSTWLQRNADRFRAENEELRAKLAKAITDAALVRASSKVEAVNELARRIVELEAELAATRAEAPHWLQTKVSAQARVITILERRLRSFRVKPYTAVLATEAGGK